MASSDNGCSICLDNTEARGGEFLVSPGCCGKWYHQRCIENLRAHGRHFCPSCRRPFPGNPQTQTAVNANPNPVPLPTQPVPQVQQPQGPPALPYWDSNVSIPGCWGRASENGANNGLSELGRRVAFTRDRIVALENGRRLPAEELLAYTNTTSSFPYCWGRASDNGVNQGFDGILVRLNQIAAVLNALEAGQRPPPPLQNWDSSFPRCWGRAEENGVNAAFEVIGLRLTILRSHVDRLIAQA